MIRVVERSRRGLIIIPALVCLVLATLFAGILARQAMNHRAVVEAEERRLQADWLAESALERAAARLAATPTYTGETWEIPAQESSLAAAVARIRVEKPSGRDTSRVARVQVDYPRVGTARARVSKQRIVELESVRPGDES